MLRRIFVSLSCNFDDVCCVFVCVIRQRSPKTKLDGKNKGEGEDYAEISYSSLATYHIDATEIKANRKLNKAMLAEDASFNGRRTKSRWSFFSSPKHKDFDQCRQFTIHDISLVR